MSAAQFFLQAVVIFLVLLGLQLYFLKTKPLFESKTSGRIRASFHMAIFAVGTAIAMIALGLWMFIIDELSVWVSFSLLLGCLTLYSMGPSLTPAHDIVWDETGIEGPTGRFFPGLPPERLRINWDDVVKTGELWTNYKYIQSQTGARILWGYWFEGEKQFTNAISEQCHNLR